MNIDNIPIKFGKYKGLAPTEIFDIDINYIKWMYKNVKPIPCSKKLFELCNENYDEELEQEMWELYN